MGRHTNIDGKGTWRPRAYPISTKSTIQNQTRRRAKAYTEILLTF